MKKLYTQYISRGSPVPLRSLSAADKYNLVALEEFHITVICPEHLVIILGGVPPSIPNRRPLMDHSRCVWELPGGKPYRITWIHSHPKILAKHPNRWLALQFLTDREGETGEHGGRARCLVGSFVSFRKHSNTDLSFVYSFVWLEGSVIPVRYTLL